MLQFNRSARLKVIFLILRTSWAHVEYWTVKSEAKGGLDLKKKKKTETSEHDNLRRSRREVRKAWGKMLKWRRSQVRSCRRLVSCSYTTVTLKETRGGGGCFGTGAPGEVKDGGWQGGGKNTWNEENMGVKNTSCSQQAMSDRLLCHPHRKPPTLANTCNTCRGVSVRASRLLLVLLLLLCLVSL